MMMRTIVFGVVFLSLHGCAAHVSLQDARPEIEARFERIVIFVNDARAIARMKRGGFTEAMSLAKANAQEGTAVRVIQFLNGHVEFKSLESADQAQLNVGRFGSDYIRRWHPRPWQCAFGIGLSHIPQVGDKKAPIYKRYRPLDEGSTTYLMAPTNNDLSLPYVFVVGDHSRLGHRSSGKMPKKPPGPGQSHSNGAKRLTRIEFTVMRRMGRPAFRPAIVPGIELQEGRRCMLSLTFDNGAQGKTMYLPAPSPVRIQY